MAKQNGVRLRRGPSSTLLLGLMMVAGAVEGSTPYLRRRLPRRMGCWTGSGPDRLHSTRSPAFGGVIFPSPIELVTVQGRQVLVKRDDQLDLFDRGVHGNKARKLYFLGELKEQGEDKLPDTFVSYGGVQSNAMAALAGMVRKHLDRPLIYYTKGNIPQWLREQPVGNFKTAVDLGVEFRELPGEVYNKCFEVGEAVEGSKEAMSRLTGLPRKYFSPRWDEKVMLIPQGGAVEGAEAGVAILAREIAESWRGSPASAGRTLAVVLPAGTGTTAYYLGKHLGILDPDSIRVYAVPCCGDGEYLKRQMARLGPLEEGRVNILEGSDRPVFARPELSLYITWSELKLAGLLVDLVYAPYAWQVMVQHTGELWKGHDAVMYVHTGGLEGLSSQLGRYRYLGIAPPNEVI